ncbi:MAG: prephenate dehydratase [Flavobacteriaceae bacterium]|nr:prephenate dehydratase [Flavobacteriaceae bacterium]
MNKPIAIQGIKGSFHHIVATRYFGNEVEVDECLSFDETVNSVISKKSDAAVMAIENSIAGSIIPNYALIDDNALHITGESYLDIQHNLMALDGQKIEDIKEVCSHPMALLQCKDFFKSYPHLKLIEERDTAEVARRISANNIKGVAAVGSELSADLYGLNIIEKSIQTIKHNETRFVILRRSNGILPKDEVNKVSLKFELEHKRGSLASILNVISDCKLNLTKIQSLPKIETPWKYAFFVDVTFENYSDYQKADSIMKIMAQSYKVLGEYKNAKL